MSFTGHVENGVVVFDGPAPPDGTAVRVEPTADNADIDPDGVLSPRMIQLIREARAEEPDAPTLAERWTHSAGMTVDLPPDATAQVDHYLYGTPKR